MLQPVNKRASERHSTRLSEILAAAARLFDELGFEKTTLEMIGREVGLTKQSLYYYLDSKEGALLEICRRGVEITPSEQLLKQAKKGAPPDELLEKYIELTTRQYFDDPTVELLARNLVFMSTGVQQEVRAELAQELRVLESIIETGCELGIFNVNNPRVAAHIVQAAAHGLSRWNMKAGKNQLEAIVEEGKSLLLEGLVLKR